MKTKIYITVINIILIILAGNLNAQNANTTLSNLISPTKVNVNLMPDKDAKRNLGSVSKNWNNIYFEGAWFKDSVQFLSSDISNLFLGDNTGENNSGNYNTAFGLDALMHHKTRDLNTAFGYHAMQYDSAGFENVAIGDNALLVNQTGGDNIAIGGNSLESNTSGYQNTAIGAGVMISNTTGYDNIATGYEALIKNSTGFRNIAVGDHGLYTNTTGSDNIAIGSQPLYKGDDAQNNVAIGSNALYATTSIYNVGVGYYALSSNTSGFRNCALGEEALSSNTTGEENTAFGDGAGSNVKTGSNNVFIGANANCGTTGAITNSTAIGSNVSITTSNSFILGDANVSSWGFGVAAGSRAIKVGTSSSNGNGAYLTQGGVWTNTSARNKKEDFQQQDRNIILQKIDQLEVTRWKYKGTDNEYHYGPMADDFHRLFNVDDDSSISDMDKTGVLFLGMQQLIKIDKEKDAKINDLQKQIDELKAMIVSNQTIVNGQQSIAASSASLSQNIPNPFSNSTTISYSIPQKYASAKIIITDKNGNALRQINLSKNKGNISVDAATISSGAYQYSLYVDGRLIDTKQMILTK